VARLDDGAAADFHERLRARGARLTFFVFHKRKFGRTDFIAATPELKRPPTRKVSGGLVFRRPLTRGTLIRFYYPARFALAARGLTRVRTVSLTGRRPKRMASLVLGIQMSILRPRTAPPVSATTYSPL
jgi:hypothetical protein